MCGSETGLGSVTAPCLLDSRQHTHQNGCCSDLNSTLPVEGLAQSLDCWLFLLLMLT